MYGKPLERMSRQKLMLEIINDISQGGTIQISFDNLLNDLMSTRKFHSDMEAETTINDYINEHILNPVAGKKRIYKFDKSALGSH